MLHKVLHYTIATRDGVSVPMCGQTARNIHSTVTVWAVTCQMCRKRLEQLEKVPRLDQTAYMVAVVNKWEDRRWWNEHRIRRV